MIKKNTRIQKIKQQIYKKISIILHQKIKNSNKFILTISNIIISSNLKYVKIYITILNCILNNKIKITEKKYIKKLKKFSKYIRFLLGKVINFKFTPYLIFIYDSSYKDSLNILSLINKK
ncbi:MAG: 30S ribosome-binding factor RbfA [Enterobacteriaceae bacterium PSpicST2]|nr:MAG: 30S ribosome-binding factor RbfA [Enterobacteriaceae bacterium PSpicST2]WMC19072.1 MAG: 30S ribosome-binding factor RbfA [Enterobacteriaceae bacterium PSpicST1]